jgi:RNA polymerase sigma-70 factor (ECF subfamily)
MPVPDDDFTRLLEARIGYVYTISFRFCADPHLAEDLAQQTLLSAWEKRTQLENPDRVTGWLRRICLNLYLLSQRKKGLFIQPEEGDGDWIADIAPLPEEELAVEEAIRELQDGCFTAMASRLTLGQRCVFILIDMFGLSIDETSWLLELSVPSTKSLLFRARGNMNAFFGHHCQWVLPENPCRCAAWYDFMGHREQLREEIRKHGGPPDFSGPEFRKGSDPGTLRKVLSLFRNLPERKPDDSWYRETASLVGSLLHSERPD